ncbi:MAG: hypothetical protein K0S97_1820 [Chloroflexota bacterium]|nr:hypothetical protein [Chloroflexota bacterium]
MGAWGTAAFDNDDASDWVYELEKDGIAAVDAALKEALGPQELETPTDVNAIAAGEVIAAALGRPVDGLGDEVLGLANSLAPSITPEHAARARTAVERVLAGSEIAELWAETEDDDEWRGLVEDLIRRLS